MKLITEGPAMYTRLPLVELPPTLPPVTNEERVTDEDIPVSASTTTTPQQPTKTKTPEPPVAEEKKHHK